MSDRATTIEVPTELDRADAFIARAVLTLVAAAFLWAVVIVGVSPWPLLVPTLLVMVELLTGPELVDVQGLGVIAAGLRSKLGQRRAHSWALAWAHYTRLVTWPAWKAAVWHTSVTLRGAVLRCLRRCLCAANTGTWCRSHYATRFGLNTGPAKRSTSGPVRHIWTWPLMLWKR